MKKWIVVLVTFAIGTYLISRFLVAKRAKDESRPNLVFITVDTLRWDHTPFGDYERQTMPNTAAFFGEGINFKTAYTVRARTTPGYASLLSGLYPQHNGVLELYQRLNNSIETLPEVLQKNGYETVAFVSSFVMIGRLNGLEQGFQIYNDMDEEKQTTRESYERRSDRTVQRTLEWLKGRQKKTPFFLFLHFIDPHGPYTPPLTNLPFRSTRKQLIEKKIIPNYQFIAGVLDLNDYVDRYDGEIYYLDQQLLPLYSVLKDYKNNTWFLFTADHGESLGDHHRYFTHGNNCYDSENRIPMVWLPPEKIRSKYPAPHADDAVSLVDIFPTIQQILRLSPETQTDGESLLPAMRGEKLKMPFRFIQKVQGEQSIFAARNSRIKLIATMKESVEYELYDLASDPGEEKNLLENQPMPADLQAQLNLYIQDSKNYRLPFIVETFPKELWRPGIERTRFMERYGKTSQQDVTSEDREKLKALGYVDQ